MKNDVALTSLLGDLVVRASIEIADTAVWFFASFAGTTEADVLAALLTCKSADFDSEAGEYVVEVVIVTPEGPLDATVHYYDGVVRHIA